MHRVCLEANRHLDKYGAMAKEVNKLLGRTAPPAPVVPEECPAELPYAQVKAVADLYTLCWQSGEVVTYTPDPEKATIWLNNYSGTCVQEYVKLERLQEALAGNSPAIPDGWIPVSERMPENKPGSYEYIVFESLNNRAHHDYWNVPDGSCDDFSPFWNHYGKYVTHWMPVPTAPEPETGHVQNNRHRQKAG